MATVTVDADNLRVNDADTTTNWGNDGGGGGVANEPDIVYQGSFAQSRKVSTSRIGRQYTHGTAIDMDGNPENRRHYLAKIAATNYNALLARTAPAMGMKVGSDASNYHEYYLFGNDNYPAKGGFQIIPIAPSVAGYTGDVADVGTPNNSAITYWSLLADFSATSKSENLVIDAIDVGAGLHIYGGDGADTDAVFQDFIDYDEGSGANRFGYVTTEGPVLLWNGRMAIGQDTGQSPVATEFNDSDRTIVWQNGLAASGFHSMRFDLGNTGTSVNITRCNFTSIGEQNNTANRGYTTSEDTRTELEVLFSSGSLAMTNCNISNFSLLNLNSGCALDNCVITNSGPIYAGDGASMVGSSVLESAVASGESALVWSSPLDPNGELDNMTFNKGGALHHAIELGTGSPWEVTLTDWNTSEFNASTGLADSTIYVAKTTGSITVNVVGGAGNFSYDSAGASVTIVIDPVTTTVKAVDGTTNVQGARVLVAASDGTGDLPYQDSVTITHSTTTASVSHTSHGMSNGDKVLIKGADQQEYNGVFTISNVTTNAYDYTMASDPGTNATGTITATGVVIDGDTDVNGEIADTRSWGNPQPIEGKIRKGTATPYYKTSTFAGTISTTAGFSQNITMVSDE